MLKGSYKAWMISIALHAVILFLFAQHMRSVSPVSDSVNVIHAYVSVDLTALPSIKKSEKITSKEKQNDPRLKPQTKKAEPSQLGQSADTKAANRSLKEPKAVQAVAAKPSKGVETLAAEPKTNSEETAEKSFKKLNPYAPIPELKFENGFSNASAFGQVNAANNNLPVGRVTVPTQLTVSDKATILWQNGNGSKRTEMLNGLCYDIDFNSVFGKSGVPSGSPRPCEDKEAKLFKEIMNKWRKK
ncbi:hypothetical protein EXT42_13750 [Pseudoalteromonas sp. CO302Y]|uniref:hypothetical protein n=1 Tax=unclassified Pseudoalteromonas TaxID=194690 RepID=UPI0010238A22|nr:hypothetical protein EXT42_13750 [Pseudoalteromonas sp. CO302Y]RZG06895.1 hypothetical protein EXT40_14530 [Pseudoalteromonas sp. CO133X]